MSASVEAIAASLVREYLSRKGLKQTLAKMDEELPRTPESISNRASLARAVHIERLMRKNKEKGGPLQTMIEVIVQQLMHKSISTASTSEHKSISTASTSEHKSISTASTSEHKSISTASTSEHKSISTASTSEHKSISTASTSEHKSISTASTSEHESISTASTSEHKSISTASTSEHESISTASTSEHKSISTASTSEHPTTTAVAPQVAHNTRRPTTTAIAPQVAHNTRRPTTTAVAPQVAHNTRRPTTTAIAPQVAHNTRRPTTTAVAPQLAHMRTTTTATAHTESMASSKKSSKVGVNAATREEGTAEKEVVFRSQKLESPGSTSLGGAGLGPNTVSRSTRSGMEPRRRGFRPRSMEEWESDQVKVTQPPEVKKETRSKPLTAHTAESSGKTKSRSAKKPHAKSATNDCSLGDLLCEDLEDEDLGMGERGTGEWRMEYPGTRNSVQKRIAGSPITMETAKMLRELLFGSATAPSFNPEWQRQDFNFCELPGLEYGLVQHKGGPCGVLACVQAYILKHLLFIEHTSGADASGQSAALVSALTDMLWKLGQGRSVVALPPSSPRSHLSTRAPPHTYTPDHLTEHVVLYSFTERSTLEQFVSSHVHIFQEETKSGCIHFLLSAILSKGIDSIRSEMDDEVSPLISTHGYCTQELVNLLLTGFAVSNAFDGTVTLDSGSTQKSVLRGLPERSQIGFLSLFESYGNCIVGSHYKEPVFPIWVVCSESHFTILFSRQSRDWQLEKRFDLFYYDGLANQEEEIRLTIDTSAGNSSSSSTGDIRAAETNTADLVPPLELCIQTKWRNAAVYWNGTEPLL